MKNEDLKYCTLSYDKFKDVTTINLSLHKDENPKSDMIPNILYGCMYYLNDKVENKRFYSLFFLKLTSIKSQKDENLFLAYKYEGENWLHLDNIVININGDENIELKGINTYKDTESMLGEVNCVEKGFFEINYEILNKICDANELGVRVYGESTYFEFKDTSEKRKSEKGVNKKISVDGISRILFLCRAFNSDVYKNDKYNSWLEEQKSADKKSGCFIATATTGDYNHQIVKELRVFRNDWLLKRKWGINFTYWYYTHGPKAAKVIGKSKLLKTLSFYLLVKPLHFIVKKLGS